MNCPVCGKGPLKRETRSMTLSCRGATLTVDQPGDWCKACGEGIFSVEDLEVTEEVRREWMARAKESSPDSRGPRGNP